MERDEIEIAKGRLWYGLLLGRTGLRSAAATGLVHQKSVSISATGTQWHDAASCSAQCGRVTPSCRCFVGPSCSARASRPATRTREIPGCQAVGVAVYARVVTSGFGRGRRQSRNVYGV